MKLNRNNVMLGLHYLILIVLVFVFIFPLLWMLLSSFKSERTMMTDLYSGFKAFLPTEVSLDNYKEVFSRMNFGKYLFNSIFVSGMTVGIGLIINSMAGYAFARLDFPGKDIIFAVIVSLVIIPFQSIVLPLFLVVKDLGMLDSYGALIIPFIANAFSIFMFRQFFLNIPKEVEEAAQIDGCGFLRTFFQVIVPMSKPVFATATILNFTGVWNQFLWPLVATTDPKFSTIQIGIQEFFTQQPVYYSQIMAALTIASLPMLILFVSLQKYFINGMGGMGK